jgi:hypothetical protein
MSGRWRPSLTSHMRPALPRYMSGRWRWEPNRAFAFQSSSAARAAHLEVRNLLQSATNWRHRCAGTSAGGFHMDNREAS